MKKRVVVFLAVLGLIGTLPAEEVAFQVKVALQPLSEDLSIYRADVLVEKQAESNRGNKPYLHPTFNCSRGELCTFTCGSLDEGKYTELQLSIPESLDEEASATLLIVEDGNPILHYAEAVEVPLDFVSQEELTEAT